MNNADIRFANELVCKTNLNIHVQMSPHRFVKFSCKHICLMIRRLFFTSGIMTSTSDNISLLWSKTSLNRCPIDMDHADNAHRITNIKMVANVVP